MTGAIARELEMVGLVCGVRWTVLVWEGLRLRRGERAARQRLRGGLWSLVDCFAVGRATTVLGRGVVWRGENGLEKVGGATIMGEGKQAEERKSKGRQKNKK